MAERQGLYYQLLYHQFIQNGKSSLDDYISKDQEKEVPTAIIIDNRDYKTNCSIWFGTNKAKLRQAQTIVDQRDIIYPIIEVVLPFERKAWKK